MEKPFTLKIQEIEKQIVNIINNSKLPAFCLKEILKSIYEEIEKCDNKEIEDYYNQKGE